MAIAKEKLGVDSPEHRNLVKAYRTSQLRRRKQSRAPAPEPPPSPPPSPPPAGKFDIGADVVYQGRNAKVVREYPGGGYLIEFEDGWRKVIRRPTELTPGKVAKEPAPVPPPLRPGVNWNYNTRNETVPGSREYVYTRAMENGYSSRESAAMITQAMVEGKSDVNNGMYVLYDRPTGTLRLKVYVPPGGPKFTKEQARDIVREREKEREQQELFRKLTAGTGVAHPKDLSVQARLSQENAKKARQKVLAATTKQAEITPDLVSRTEIVVTNTPHGKRSRALASHTGQLNTLHVKPETLIGDNAQAVLDHGQSSGWWSKTDKEHDLAMNVMTHEFGHGVHGEVNRLGFISANRHSPFTTNPEEQEFWRGFARVMGVEEPQALQWDYGGPEKMNVASWHSLPRVNQAIQKQVGRYASKNMNEMFAELWTEYRLSSNPRPPAKYFGDWISERLRMHERAIA